MLLASHTEVGKGYPGFAQELHSAQKVGILHKKGQIKMNQKEINAEEWCQRILRIFDSGEFQGLLDQISQEADRMMTVKLETGHFPSFQPTELPN